MTNAKSKIGQVVFYKGYQAAKTTKWVILGTMKCKCACHNKVRINYFIQSLEDPMFVYGGLCAQRLTFAGKKTSDLLQTLFDVGL